MIHWRRPLEFINNDDAQPRLFGEASEEMKIGEIQNKWLFSTIKMLHREGLLGKLFKTKQEYSAEGVYAVKICNNGEWQEVVVDEFIPCYPKGG